jgi:sulfate transport system permease protein
MKRSTIIDPIWFQTLMIAIATMLIGIIIVLPVASIFIQATTNGLSAYRSLIIDEEARSAILLTLQIVAVVVPLNGIFGIIAAWCLTKFEFHGKTFLLSLIDLPFSVSPVIVGLIYILALGKQSIIGNWLSEHNIQIIFATPGLILVSLFVTFPIMARELLPIMKEHGSQEEEMAVVLGANGWQVFWNITLPNIKRGIIYGAILSSARTIGEFGAVSMVSGHIRNITNTVPLYVEVLYNDYNTEAAFALSSVMVVISIVTLVIKSILHKAK